MTPKGVPYKQSIAYDLSLKKHIIIICGHYEGFDERIRSLADLEVSIGDYILTGGEIPSMVLIDSITRLVDGVIEKESHEKESFNNNLLDYPVYTKPVNFRGMEVPSVLLSGHHKNIENYRYEQQLEMTKTRRPDLLEKSDMKKQYSVLKENSNKDGVILENKNGYKVKPKNKVPYDGIKVNEVTIVDENMIQKVIKRKIKTQLNKYLRIIESDDEDGARIALDDLSRYRKKIGKKYKKYLQEEYISLIRKKMGIIEQELKKKVKQIDEEKETHHTR